MTKTIMIVDDSQDDIELMEIALKASGHEVKTRVATRGETALKYLRDGEDKPVLILLDLKIPGMSGVDLLRKIRADARFNEIPVVVVTSSSLPMDEDNAYAAGSNGYLLKAMDLKKFNKDIKSLLDRWVPN